MTTSIYDYQNEVLISLEEALHPHIDVIPDIVRYVTIAKYNYQDFGNNMTRDEFAAILIFTMEWVPEETCLYRVVNEILRSEDQSKLKPWLPYVKLLLAALNKLPSYEGTVWRQITGELSSEYQQGQTGVWWSITSTTSDTNMFNADHSDEKKSSRTVFLIECKHGKSIEKYSMFRKEKEVILMPGFHFQILGKLDLGDGSFMINIKEI